MHTAPIGYCSKTPANENIFAYMSERLQLIALHEATNDLPERLRNLEVGLWPIPKSTTVLLRVGPTASH
jgi:hypothetical protein